MTTDEIKSIIKSRMQNLSITEYRLEQLTGISRSFLGRWFKGEHRMTIEKFLLICEALEINIDESTFFIDKKDIK
jgi:transcriptional regulator with XRE-family HTH domain